MYTVNGIGTTLIGKTKRQGVAPGRDPDFERGVYGDYSYQAVKWFTFFFLPVIPLGTYRVRTTKEGGGLLGTTYHQMQRMPWDWGQVASHYAVGYGPILVLVILAALGIIKC